MALGESYSWGSIDNYFSAVASFGDFNFNDPNHHGTPQERLASAQLGFQTALEVIQTGTPVTYADLHQIFATAIGGFSERRINTKTKHPTASHFLGRLDTEQILDILKGVNHGRDASVPSVENRERLYPRKE
jgi:hypothetical protein